MLRESKSMSASTMMRTSSSNRHFRFPIENLLRFRRVTEQQVDLGRALVARVVFYELLPIQINVREGRLDELAHSVRFTGSQHEVVAFAELHNSPHAFDVLRRVSPIAFCVQIAEEQFLLQPCLMAATAREILRLTKVSPRRGLSWLNIMPLLAQRP